GLKTDVPAQGGEGDTAATSGVNGDGLRGADGGRKARGGRDCRVRLKRARRPRRRSDDQPRPDLTPLDVAARLLARASLTEAALRARLVAEGYQQATADRTVARC